MQLSLKYKNTGEMFGSDMCCFSGVEARKIQFELTGFTDRSSFSWRKNGKDGWKKVKGKEKKVGTSCRNVR